MSIWIVIIVTAIILEAAAILRGDTKELPTLTRVIKTHIPRWLVAVGIAWLVYHFLIEQSVGYITK